MATLFVKAVGKSTLGLAYGLSIAEMFLAPAMPSTTARAGGIFMPIINSLSIASGSEPGASNHAAILRMCRRGDSRPGASHMSCGGPQPCS